MEMLIYYRVLVEFGEARLPKVVKYQHGFYHILDPEIPTPKENITLA